jgi:putative N6-adenine-specific DNA methylase
MPGSDRTVAAMVRPPARHDALVVCLPGLEAVTTAELTDLGVRARRSGPGALSAPMTTRQLYAANLHLRTATRVLVTVAGFGATGFAELERRARAVAWDDLLPAGTTVRLRVTSHRSRLHHTGAVAERVAGAIGRDQDPDGPLVVVRLDRDRVTMRVDTSGAPLHRRGWRPALAKAPLRESVAAAMLSTAGWPGPAALVDPCCGSGTLPIEAATMARRLAPGRARRFAFQDTPGFEPGTWASVRGAAAAAERPEGSCPPMLGSDRDEGAVAAARANAERAGVAADVDIRPMAVSDVAAPTPEGLLIANLPYGHRVGSGGGDLRNLYARLGQVARVRFARWQVGVLVADPVLAGHMGLPLVERLRFDNGGIPVRFLVGPATPGEEPAV